MSSSQRMHDDELFQEMLAPLDEVRASDRLKNTTLEAIFAEMDEEDKEVPQRASSQDIHPQMTLVEGGASTSIARAHKRRNSWLAKVAALVVVTVLSTGGIAYAMPASQVTVTEGETSVSLAVNVFGITLSAKTDDEEVQTLIEHAQLNGSGYEEALDRVIDLLSSRGIGDGSVGVDISGGHFAGQKERMDASASRVIEGRDMTRGEGGRAQDMGEAGPSSQSSAPENVANPAAPGRTPAEPSPVQPDQTAQSPETESGTPPMQDGATGANPNGGEPAMTTPQAGQGQPPMTPGGTPESSGQP